jgi:hypothetical protein
MRALLRFAALLVATTLGCRAQGDPGASRARGGTSAAPSTVVRPTGVVGTATSTALVGPRTHAVITGVLTWQDKSLAPFSAIGRKDRELSELLVSRAGVPPKEVTTLLDGAATRAAILAALESAAARTRSGDTLVFYYAGHGVRGADDAAYLAPVDIVVSNAASTGIGMRALAAALDKTPAGAKVLLLGDHCYSGALREVAEALSKRGIEAASLTSAEASNISTGNWTFTQTVLDALNGDPLADRNGDRAVALEEVALETRDAMKFREAQRSGFWTKTLAASTFALVTAPAPAPVSGAPRLGEYVKLRGKPKVVGRVVRAGSHPKQVVVRKLDYATVSEEPVPQSKVVALRFSSYPVGQSLSVEWEGKPFDARVTEVDGDFMRITYPGWSAAWDEWILSNRVVADSLTSTAPARHVGDKVEVEWNGEWWPASVVQISNKLCLVHYDGYADRWDEWVGSKRIRSR